MSKKWLRMKCIMTLVIFALVSLKIIHWLCHPELNMIELKTIQHYIENKASINLVVYYGIYASAFFSLITIWLPSKAQPTFGTISVLVSGTMGLVEFGFFVIFKIGYLSDHISLFTYTGLDPLLTVGVFTAAAYVTVTSDEDYNNKLRSFFSTGSMPIAPGSAPVSITSNSRADIYGNKRGYRRQEIQNPKPAKENSKTIVEIIGRRLVATAVAAFALCTVCVATEAAIGMFIVLMPVTVICLIGGVMLLYFNHTRKH